jgi:hypothetical protein
MGAYPPATKTNILKKSKHSEWEICTHTSTFYVHTQSFMKTRLFVACVKNKKNLGKQPFLTPNLVFLTHDTKNVGFRDMAL